MDNRNRSVAPVQDELDALKFFLPESDTTANGPPPYIASGSAADLGTSHHHGHRPVIELTRQDVDTDVVHQRPAMTVGRRRRQAARSRAQVDFTIGILTTIAIRTVSWSRWLLSSLQRAGHHTGHAIARARTSLRVHAHLPKRPSAWNATSFCGGILVGALVVQLFGFGSPSESPSAPAPPSTSLRPASPSSAAAVATTFVQGSPKAAAISPVPPSSTAGPSDPGGAGNYRGGLRVDSQPAGATVFVNNERVGQTPLALRSLPVGSRAIRLELTGYARWSRSVRIVANQSATVSARLEPAR